MQKGVGARDFIARMTWPFEAKRANHKTQFRRAAEISQRLETSLSFKWFWFVAGRDWSQKASFLPYTGLIIVGGSVFKRPRGPIVK